ncbi:hypothetical protein [Brevibacillus fluminis]|nr:hypothetical protein [Brevibacillus fluminis]
MMVFRRILYSLLTVVAAVGLVYAYKSTSEPMASTNVETADAETHAPFQVTPKLEVNHRLEKHDLHLEMKVTNFTFSLENMGKENKDGEGHVHLYIDGKKVMKLFGSSYVWKDMQPGQHLVTVELAHNNHDSYGVKQEFKVDVKE